MAETHKDSQYIQVTEGGPYLVFGVNKIVEQIIVPDEEGASDHYQDGKDFSTEEKEVALCRCGHSKNAPFCDGSHQHTKWDSKETASFEPIMDDAQAFEGPNLTLFDNEKYCAYARFCDAKGRIWNLVMEGAPETDRQAVKEAFLCPAGRLMMHDNATGKAMEPELDPSIGVLEDPALGVSGPLWVKGGVKVVNSNGKSYEVRNRQTLCRCGCSENKPFCDGSHASVKYQDGIKKART